MIMDASGAQFAPFGNQPTAVQAPYGYYYTDTEISDQQIPLEDQLGGKIGIFGGKTLAR